MPTGIWQEAALGFLYWLGVVLMLEPGNIARALEGGGGLPVGQELFRLTGAASIGALATLAVFTLVRTRPIEGEAAPRHAVFHLGADLALAVAMIGVAGVLAALFLSEEKRPLPEALLTQLTVDGPIVFFGLAALTAIAHGMRILRLQRATAAAKAGYLTSVTAKLRNRTEVVDLAQVSWIETQGNYLALHVGPATHLIRETLRRFEGRIDPARFVRIHRQTIVALGAIRQIESLASGDATVILDDGTELRMSRLYRDVVRDRLGQRSA